MGVALCLFPGSIPNKTVQRDGGLHVLFLFPGSITLHPPSQQDCTKGWGGCSLPLSRQHYTTPTIPTRLYKGMGGCSFPLSRQYYTTPTVPTRLYKGMGGGGGGGGGLLFPFFQAVLHYTHHPNKTVLQHQHTTTGRHFVVLHTPESTSLPH